MKMELYPILKEIPPLQEVGYDESLHGGGGREPRSPLYSHLLPVSVTTSP